LKKYIKKKVGSNEKRERWKRKGKEYFYVKKKTFRFILIKKKKRIPSMAAKRQVQKKKLIPVARCTFVSRYGRNSSLDSAFNEKWIRTPL
jgi:hypothetical protein